MRRKCLFHYVWLAALLVMSPHFAIAAPASSTQYRYLFLIDTAEAMGRHQAEVKRFVAETIRNGFNGWARQNDPIGFWAFNTKVHRDVLPVEFWSPSQKDRIAEQIENLLPAHATGSTARFDLALAEMHKLVARVDAVTVFIVSDGRQPMRGTPFDARINDAYRSLASALVPGPVIVTRLTRSGGQFNAWTVQGVGRFGSEIWLIDSTSVGLENSAGTIKVAANAFSESVTNSASKFGQVPLDAAETKKNEPEKPLPPAPALPKELIEPFQVAPLSFDEDDQTGKARRARSPVIVLNVATSEAVERAGENSAPTALPGEPNTQASAPVAVTPKEPAGTPATLDPSAEPLRAAAGLSNAAPGDVKLAMKPDGTAATLLENKPGAGAANSVAHGSGVTTNSALTSAAVVPTNDSQAAKQVSATAPPVETQTNVATGQPETPRTADPLPPSANVNTIAQSAERLVNGAEASNQPSATANVVPPALPQRNLQSDFPAPIEAIDHTTQPVLDAAAATVSEATPDANQSESSVSRPEAGRHSAAPTMAAVTPSATGGRLYLGAGIALLLISATGAWFFLRTSRVPRQPSLISRGLEKDGQG